jgi:hypothetical protein
MKFQSIFFSALLVTALAINVSRAATNLVVTDTNLEDIFVITSPHDFSVEDSGGTVIGTGHYNQQGFNAIILSLPNGLVSSPYPNNPTVSDDDLPFFTQLFNPSSPTPDSTSDPYTTTTTVVPGIGATLPVTVIDYGTSIVITSTANQNLENLLRSFGNSTFTFGVGTNNNGGGNNNGNGSGDPSGPPGGGGNPSSTPEPSTWALLFCSLAGLLIFQRFRFNRR